MEPTQEPDKRNPDAGTVRIRDATIEYESRLYGSWQLVLSEIAVIGEFTNENGPGEDWFWVFVTHDTMAFSVPTGAIGFRETRPQVEQLLQCAIDFELAWCTSFASRVLWPSALKGRPLFHFSPVPRSRWHRVLFFLQPDQIASELTAEVLSECRTRNRK
jgi:hypothetical protein